MGSKRTTSHTNFGSICIVVFEDSVDIYHKGIRVDKDKDPVQYNVHQVRSTTYLNITALNWKGLVIICTRKSSNIHNSSAVFTNYSQEDILCMSRLDFILILFPVNFLKVIPILDINKVLVSLMNLQEFIRWVGCCHYMDFWVGVPNF